MNLSSDLDVLFKPNSLSVISSGSEALFQTSTSFLKGITYTEILFPMVSQCFWTKGYLYVCLMYAYVYMGGGLCVYLIYCYIGIGSSGIKCAYSEDTVATLTQCSRLVDFSHCPPVLVPSGVEFFFFLVGDTVLCVGFSMSMMLITLIFFAK